MSVGIDVAAELREIIAVRIESHERSQQRMIGASELGTPCIRKLALKLAQVDPVPEQIVGDDKWRPTVGTAVHEWLAAMLRAENDRLRAEAAKWNYAKGSCHEWCDPLLHVDRWLVEYSTPIGTLDGEPVPGNLDAFDRLTGTLIDWKVVGPTTIKKVKSSKDPGAQYKVQAQLYGRGLSRAGGEDVKYVAVMYLPSNGELKDSFYWEEAFDPEVGKDALARARELKNLVDEEGESIFRKLKTVNDFCQHCPFFSPGTNSPVECPGDASLTANMDDGLADVLPNG